MSELVFRRAGAGDAPAIVSLVQSAYRGDVSRQGWTTEADFLDGQRTSEDDLQPILADPHQHVLLGEREGQLLVCCHLEPTGDAAYFGMFSVSPKAQGGGIGSLMMQHAERYAREVMAATRMTMTVIDIRDELMAYYQRRGYLRTGIKKPFPYGDERFGIPKRDDLRFEVMEKAL